MQLRNATLYFRRATAMGLDPATGNEVPVTWEIVEIGAYFKKSRINDRPSEGVPIGSYSITGYIDGTLPAWCNTPTDPKIQCDVSWLGRGWFYHQGAVGVVRDRVESISGGTPIQGYFVIQGSN